MRRAERQRERLVLVRMLVQQETEVGRWLVRRGQGLVYNGRKDNE